MKVVSRKEAALIKGSVSLRIIDCVAPHVLLVAPRPRQKKDPRSGPPLREALARALARPRLSGSRGPRGPGRPRLAALAFAAAVKSMFDAKPVKSVKRPNAA